MHDSFLSPERLPRIGYEATVGTALPFIKTLQDLIVSGDDISKVEGILSGSIGWILSKWQRMKNSNLDYDKRKGLFAEIIMDAHSLRLSEPDPRDDILGIDSARKAVILGRTLGLNCDVESVLKNTLNLLPLSRDRLVRMSPAMFTQTICEIGETELETYLWQSCADYNYSKKGNNDAMNLKYVTVIDADSDRRNQD